MFTLVVSRWVGAVGYGVEVEVKFGVETVIFFLDNAVLELFIGFSQYHLGPFRVCRVTGYDKIPYRAVRHLKGAVQFSNHIPRLMR